MPAPSRGWGFDLSGALADWSIVERRPAWLWPYGGLALLLVLVMWPTWTNPTRLLVGSDLLLQHFPLQVLWRDALAARELPWWNPYVLSGMPAYPDPLASYTYPPHW